MNYNRKSPRLKQYDYSNVGWYFVTVCVKDYKSYFGDVVDGEILLNEIGKIVEICWMEIPEHYGFVDLDYYVIMPNHIHGIIIIDEPPTATVGKRHASSSLNNNIGFTKRNGHVRSLRSNLSNVVGSFKSAVSKNVNDLITIA